MKLAVENGITSLILRVFIQDSASTTGDGKTGLSHTSTGMIIALIADNEATATAYTVTASNVETITTLGTFAAPTASKCRFKEVDATNLPGVYELHFANARWAVSSARSVQGMITGASGAVACPFEVQLANVPANVITYASGQAPDNATITLINNKTTNLPSDPADQSLIVAATDAIITRLGSPAGASISADIALVQTTAGQAANDASTTVDSLGAIGTSVADILEDTGITIPNLIDGIGGGDASQTTLLAVKAKTDLIGTAQANVALTAAAVLNIGSITGFPTELVVGDSYDSDSGEIEVSILDADGDPITAIGSLQLEDATIEFTAYRTGDPSSLHISGTCSYAASVVSISLASSATALGKPEFTYEGRLKFIWDTEDAQKTFKTTQFKFVENP